MMLNLRSAFTLPPTPDAIELRAFTHGLMPRTVSAMMQRFTEDWAEHGVDAWNEVPNHWRPSSGERVGWWTLPTYLGDAFIAPLIGASAGTCIMQPNVHWTVQCLLSAPETFRAGRRVVLTEAEFPSVLHSLRRWAPLLGLDLAVVPLQDDGFVDQEAVLDAIDDQTGLVVLSHVGFTTGERLPDDFLRAVARQIHRHDGLFVVDGYHSTGSLPVQAARIEADVYMGGLLKEACGSSGNAFVYLREGLDLRPRASGWFGDEDPFGFGPMPADHPDVRRRFLGGTTAVASFYHAVEGVRLLLDAGLDAVHRHSLALTERSIALADQLGLPLRSPREPGRRSAMIILEVPAADRLCAYLKTQHIYTDSRKGRYLRLAPFVWNTLDEVERTFVALGEAIDEDRYADVTVAEHGPVT